MNVRSTLFASTLFAATLAAAVPIAFAQTDTATASDPAGCSTALDALHAARSSFAEQNFTLHRQQADTLHAAVKAALTLTAPDARTEAIQAAHQAAHEAKSGAMEMLHDELADEQEDVKNSCAGLLPGKGMRWHKGRGITHGGFFLGRFRGH